MWQLKADSLVIPSPETTFGLQSVDFSKDVNTSNNSKFAIKIVFFGPNSTGTSGNDRFDNITVKGIPLSSQDNPTLSISSDKNNVCSNSKVTFTAKTTNAGASPTFQWIKNNVNVGTNKNTFVDSSFENQDFVYCTLTVNNTILTSNKVYITVSANPVSITGLSKNSPSACGNNDGDITINRSGGTSPFQYSLGNGNYFSSNLFTNLGAGTYTAYVKDARGCTASLTDSLVKIPALAITLSKTSPSACGSNNGSITINNSGGNSPFKYSLNNINYFATNVFSNLAAGKYTAYVKDADNCIASVTDVLANASALVITSLDKTSPSGCNTNDGTITVNNSGGSSPFKYSLDNTNYFSSNTFSNLAAGSYTAYVKDAQGCTTSFNDVLSNNSSLVLTGLSPTSPTSCITDDGSIMINTSGGSSPFQYSLDSVNYSSGNVFSNLGAGTYTGYVRDNRGCTASFTDVIDKYSSSLEINDLTKTSASACRNDGSIHIKVNEGYLPFQYSLDNVDYNSGNAFTNLAAGTYTAYVKDAKGCLDSVTDILDKVPPIVVSLTKTPTTACSNDGTINIDNSGGNSPFKYSLDNVSYSTDNVFNDLAAGAYTAYVKDHDGCVDSLSDVVTKIPIDVTLNTASASACSDDGSITINNSGGASPYKYSLNNVNYFSSNVFTSLAAGMYTGYVKDANGCIDSLSTELTRPSAVTITSIDKASASACSDDGSITINNSGGTSPYQYSLDDIIYSSSNTFTNLASGTYTVYVKDAKGCTASLTDVLAGTSSLVIAGLTKTSPACSNNGIISINNSGGTSPYQYSLDNINYFSGNTFTNLAAGAYTAYVKDAKGCTAALSDTLTGSSPVVITSVSKTSPVCNNNGSITINNSGGNSPYQYSLDNVNYFSGNTFTNLAAGTYTAYVKDANGCTVSLNDALTGPAPLGITSLSKTSPSCVNDGTITINKSGGTSPYQYSLDNVNYFSSNTFTNLAAGNYTAYVKDVNGCAASLSDMLTGSSSVLITSVSTTSASACINDGNITIIGSGGASPYQYSLDNVNYSSGNVFDTLTAGSYTAYVKDMKGCIGTSSNIAVAKVASIVVTAGKTSASACLNDGIITLSKTGGTTPYSYSINGTAYQSGSTFTGLAAKTYTGYVKDSKGCIGTLPNIVVGKVASIVVTATKTSASSCHNDGTIALSKTGGTTPYSYSINGTTYQSGNTFTGLAAKAYTGYVKDSKGCVGTLPNIVVGKVASIVVTATKTSASSCHNDGTIALSKTGGTTPYSYSINGTTYQSGSTFTGLAAKTYTGYVKDSKGCVGTLGNITVSKAAALIVSVQSKTNATTCSSINGSINLAVSGGVSPFRYSINNSTYSSSSLFSFVSHGTYTGYVLDNRGCTGSVNNIVIGPTNCSSVKQSANSEITDVKIHNFKIETYPNPSSTEFTLVVTSNKSNEVYVVVRDILGRVVYSSKGSSSGKYFFGKTFPSGIYVAEVLQGKELKTLKLVKAK